MQKTEGEPSLSGSETTDADEIPPDTGLVAYLRIAEEVNANIKNVPLVKVILGNCTCDMDSAACTLAYAYLLHIEASNSVLLCDKPILPVFNIDAASLKLKTEVCYILEKLQIPLDLLITRDKINLVELATEKKLEMVLVDHHELQVEDEVLESCVMQVIDHRPLCRHWPVPRSLFTIEQVGSCASLIANKIMDRHPDILMEDTQVPQLLYGAILLDTMNFSPISKRFTELDVRMVTQLEICVLGEGDSRLAIYQELLSARTNVQNFTSLECLMKDVKIGGGNPVCTLPMLVQEFSMRPDAESALHALMASSNYELIVLIGIAGTGEDLRRDVGFFTIDAEKLCAEVEKTLENACFLDLALEKIPESPIPRLDIYNQYNMEHTRKHILPVIQLAVQSFKEETDELPVQSFLGDMNAGAVQSVQGDTDELAVPSFQGDTDELVAPAFHGDTDELAVPSFHGDTDELVVPAFHGDTDELAVPSFHGDTDELVVPAFHGDTDELAVPSFHGDTDELVVPAFHGDTDDIADN